MEPLQDSSSESNTQIETSVSKSSSSSSFANNFVSSLPKISCFFDPSSCQLQIFSIPEKIVYYMAKNVTNAKTYQKLVESCKYFYKVNPVIIVPNIKCYGREWDACYELVQEYEFKYNEPLNFKIWITDEISIFSYYAQQLIPLIYKNDAKAVYFDSSPLRLENFLFFVGNAKKLSMSGQMVKYANSETVQLEDIVKNLPNVKKLDFSPCMYGNDVNSSTLKKLMEIEHFKNISRLDLSDVSEVLNVEEMFNFIIENPHISVYLRYRQQISDAYKELVEQYANLLEKELGYDSVIKHYEMDFDTSSSENDSFGDNLSDSDENEELLFPWKNDDDEEWELPWDKE